ncbi:alkaline phosphatase D family protein [Nocardioides korecus]
MPPPTSPAYAVPSRRSVLRAGLATGATATLLGWVGPLDSRATAAVPALPRTPFTLGVASGDPFPTSVLLWTRLAIDPLADDGHGGMPTRTYPVRWQVAHDARFRKVVRSGTAQTGPDQAHSVHVEVGGLRPGAEYFYRFRVGTFLSPVGRTRTAPAHHSLVPSLSMAFASCAQYERGWFTAYRRLAQDEPDLVLHLGDYMYEFAAKPVGSGGTVRSFRGPETVTLANYRQRLAQYHADPDLQAAHAVAPWLVVFDDHDVDNDWAGDVPDDPREAAAFPARRAAAFKAYYENMPLRHASIPTGSHMAVNRRLQWGRLAMFHMLDTRQFRSDQACGDGWKDCPEAAAPARSLPGAAQEAWLSRGFARSRARWDVLGQQVFFSRRATSASPHATVAMDAWDGYPTSRARVISSWVKAGVRNPIVLTGDVHAHWASDIRSDFTDRTAPVVGSEFITSSVTSGGDGYDEPTGRHPWFANNPHLKFWTNLRGYVNTTITPASFTAEYRCLPQVSVPDSPVHTRARFVVHDRVRGMQQTYAAPLPPASAARTAPRTDAQKIRDTLATEAG